MIFMLTLFSLLEERKLEKYNNERIFDFAHQ